MNTDTDRNRFKLVFFLLCFSIIGRVDAGTIASGQTLTGSIGSATDVDTFSFTVDAGDSIEISAGDVSSLSNSFEPSIVLYGPDGSQLTSDWGSYGASIEHSATVSGSYSVTVSDAFTNASGDYRLTMVRISGSQNDPDGKVLTSGETVLRSLPIGDIDVFTFSASSGDGIHISAGDVSTVSNSFEPYIILYGPDGSVLGGDYGNYGAYIESTATASGVFTVTVRDAFANASGDYRLTTVRAPAAQNDPGGKVLSSGETVSRPILVGDIDVFTFSANSGDSIEISAGDVSTVSDSFEPYIILYGPDGSVLGGDYGSYGAWVSHTATAAGIFTVTVRDAFANADGDYRLTMVRVPGEQSDPNGRALSSGETVSRFLPVGDIDIFTISADIGSSLEITLSDATGTGFSPLLALYAPDGSLIDKSWGSSSAGLNHSALQAGTYYLVIEDAYTSNSGDYTLGLSGNITSADPAMSSVDPDPAPLINGKQPFTIYGSNFDPACTVTLRDHRTGELFPNRTKVSQTDSSIELSVNLTAAPAEWSVEVINPGGVSSGRYWFQVGQEVIPGLTVSHLSISGPSAISSGSIANYTATLHYTDGSTADVTGAATFFTSLPVGSITRFLGSELHSEVNDVGQSIHAYAQYRSEGGQVTSSAFLVSIEPSRYAELNLTQIFDPSNTVRAELELFGFSESSTISWDFLDDGSYDWWQGQAVEEYRYFLISQSKLVSFRIYDPVADVTYIDEKRITMRKAPAGEQPPLTWLEYANAGDIYNLGGYVETYDSDREFVASNFSFLDANKEKGLVVLVHGINDSAEGEWIQNLKDLISSEINSEYGIGEDFPNVLIYDWREDAGQGFLEAVFENVLVTKKVIANGVTHGSYLKNILCRIYDAGYIDQSAPIHLIGHSAGGFVIGQCAEMLNLDSRELYVDRVTILDTPTPPLSLLYNLPKSGTFLERVVTSYYGATYWDEIGSPGPSALYEINYEPNKFIAEAAQEIFLSFLWGHSYAHKWYRDTVNGSDVEGFRNSPLLTGILNANKDSLLAPLSSPLVRLFASAESVESKSGNYELGFAEYGSIFPIADGYQLLEVSSVDSGIFKDMLIPEDAYGLAFKYHFDAGDIDDVLTVTIEDVEYVLQLPNISTSQGNTFETFLPVAGLGGQIKRVEFNLAGIDPATSDLSITEICFLTSDDIDNDGVLNSEEMTNYSSDPYKRDTDDDGLNDGDELNLYGTSLILADTDGDGQKDGDEIAAGTDPLSNGDLLQITDFRIMPDNSVDLSWSSKSDKTYRVYRTESLDFLNYSAVGGGAISGQAGTTNLTDTPPGDAESIFYWVEVENF